MVSEHDRRELYEAAEQAWGPAPAGTLMELLPPAGWGDLVRAGDLALFRSELRGEMAELRGEMAELRGELRGEMAGLRGELGGKIDAVRSELDGKIAAQLPRLVAVNIASMIGVAGLVLTAARFA
jgi:hypothetical protein